MEIEEGKKVVGRVGAVGSPLENTTTGNEGSRTSVGLSAGTLFTGAGPCERVAGGVATGVDNTGGALSTGPLFTGVGEETTVGVSPGTDTGSRGGGLLFTGGGEAI